MDQENLRLLLTELRRELTAQPPTDDRSRQLLVELQRDIECTIAKAPGDQGPATKVMEINNDWSERVREAMASFEGAHPHATGTLERVMTLLSNFGL